jgi:MFS transporter, PHS family, inorganic phosphate transporter
LNKAAISPKDVFSELRNLIIANMLLSVVGLIPGYWMTFFLIDKIGRKRIQLIGFGMLTILFVIMGERRDEP